MQNVHQHLTFCERRFLRRRDYQQFDLVSLFVALGGIVLIAITIGNLLVTTATEEIAEATQKMAQNDVYCAQIRDMGAVVVGANSSDIISLCEREGVSLAK